MTEPTDAEALAALRTLRAWLAGPVAPTEYHQDRLPNAVTRDAFLRRHRMRMHARVPGWTRVGQARLVTREAWDADVGAETTHAASRSRPRLSVVCHAPTPSIDSALDSALGIRTRSAR
jgi:hypothetical protein